MCAAAVSMSMVSVTYATDSGPRPIPLKVVINKTYVSERLVDATESTKALE